jgi:hypothetical protein
MQSNWAAVESVDQSAWAEREATSSVHPRGKVRALKNAPAPASPSPSDQARVKALSQAKAWRLIAAPHESSKATSQASISGANSGAPCRRAATSDADQALRSRRDQVAVVATKLTGNFRGRRRMNPLALVCSRARRLASSTGCRNGSHSFAPYRFS